MTTLQDGNVAIASLEQWKVPTDKPTQMMSGRNTTGLNIQKSRLLDYKDKDPLHDPSNLSDEAITASNEYRAYTDPTLVWQRQLHLTRKEALLACRLILSEMRQGVSINWNRDARTYAMKARCQVGTEPKAAGEKKAPGEAIDEKKVTTLCNRDFQAVVPGRVAKHCFVWGHPRSVEAVPENITQKGTMTYDDGHSGTMDPVPVKNTTCTRTFDDIDPEVVRQNYRDLCNPDDFNLVSFNCCTCAYLALSAAGAKLTASDFPCRESRNEFAEIPWFWREEGGG